MERASIKECLEVHLRFRGLRLAALKYYIQCASLQPFRPEVPRPGKLRCSTASTAFSASILQHMSDPASQITSIIAQTAVRTLLSRWDRGTTPRVSRRTL
jgi:hypothetical protein